MVGRVVVTESCDKFLDANDFVSQGFECDDQMFPKSLKFSLLREKSSEGRQIG